MNIWQSAGLLYSLLAEYSSHVVSLPSVSRPVILLLSPNTVEWFLSTSPRVPLKPSTFPLMAWVAIYICRNTYKSISPECLLQWWQSYKTAVKMAALYVCLYWTVVEIWEYASPRPFMNTLLLGTCCRLCTTSQDILHFWFKAETLG